FQVKTPFFRNIRHPAQGACLFPRSEPKPQPPIISSHTPNEVARRGQRKQSRWKTPTILSPASDAPEGHAFQRNKRIIIRLYLDLQAVVRYDSFRSAFGRAFR